MTENFVGNWKYEHGPEYDVPAAILEAAPDMSWHNDACPSFGVTDDEARITVCIWVEHPDKDQRETGSEHRFSVTLYTETEDHDAKYEGDDVDEAIRVYQELVREYEVTAS